MNIRPMTQQDKARSLEMVRAFYNSNAVEHPVPAEVQERTFDAACGGDPLLKGFVLEQDGQVVGFAYITFFYACEVGGRVVMLEELFICEEARGKGLGQAFIDWMLAQYPDAKRFRLEVTEENTGAIRLYERNGFRMLGYQQMVLDRE